ncbi:MAG: hypothetical protein GY724_22050 [Actinomycetia bacterium]|nr:hypothetical protein [Actinomycetes bacterium]
MSWPAALLTKRRRFMALFVGAELVLAMSVPFLAIGGYHALLNSRAGRFVEQPGEGDPGWRALVDPSPLVAVVEIEGEQITGIALLAGTVDEAAGGTVILVPANLQVDDAALADREPAEAVAALSGALRLRITAIEQMTRERWQTLLGDKAYQVSNPDPIVNDFGQPILAVGPATIDGSTVSTFLGLPAPGADSITLMFRRHIFWSAMVSDPPMSQMPGSDDPLLESLDEVTGPAARVVDLPLMAVEPNPTPDLAAAEALIREVVPVPAGAHPGDRLQVRVIDRTGVADLPAIAAEVASTGSEVIEIGNAPEFDGGLTHLVVPTGFDDPGISELASLTGATTVHDDEIDADPVVTLLIGSDFVTNR